MKNILKKMAAAIIMMTAVFISPTISSATPLKNGTPEEETQTNKHPPNFNSIGAGANRVQYREKSHNTRDVKNSVMGDVNIRVGHDKLDIKMDSNSSGNSVDASVSSTIILGDMKK